MAKRSGRDKAEDSGRDADWALHGFPDRAVRHVLDEPQNLAEFVAAVLPEAAGRFDFERRVSLTREFLLEDWRGRESDVLIEVPFRGDDGEQDVLVCVLVEHQSTPDPRMPLRVLLYAVLYWERKWKAWEERRGGGERLRLVPVLPIVLHTGQGEWKTGRDLGELFEAPELLRSFIPRWPILFWEIGEQSTEGLLNAAGAFLQTLAVVRADRESVERFQAVLAEVLSRLERIEPKQRIRWHDLVHFALSWAFHRRPVEEHGELQRIAVESQHARRRKREVEAMSSTLGKTWEDILQERQAESELRARRDALRLVLEERFTVIPPDVLERIEAETDAGRLNAWTRQAVRVASVDQLQI